MQYFHSVFELFSGVVLVFFSALAFVNAIEFIGYRLKLGKSFVGAIVSPLFTSLPELTVFTVALLSNVRGGTEIGLGTIFGQPFMASSLSYGLVGLAVLFGYKSGKRTSYRLKVDRSLLIPYTFVTVLFPLTLIPGFIRGRAVRLFFGMIFVLSFIAYMVIMYLKRRSGIIEDFEELYLSKIFSCEKITFLGLLQLGIATGILYYGSKKLVSAVSNLSTITGISPLGIALVLVPFATAIPETISALIWGYRGKDTMSLGSLVGEKILYSTFYPGIGLFFTGWKIDDHAVFSVVTTTVVSLILLYFISKDEVPWQALFSGIIFFFAYTIFIFILH